MFASLTLRSLCWCRSAAESLCGARFARLPLSRPLPPLSDGRITRSKSARAMTGLVLLSWFLLQPAFAVL
jgi:hypothetical protein